MKYFLFILIAPALLLVMSCENSSNTIKGNGDLITIEKPFLHKFEEISISTGANVRFHSSNEYKIVVTVDSNLAEYALIDTKNNKLEIGTMDGKYSFTKYLLDVYAPKLSAISISGSGSFSNIDTINVHNIDVNISGSGSATLSGNSDNSNIDISGSGAFYGQEFNTKNANVSISGSGMVHIGVTNNLKANISGSGSLIYKGNPKTDFNISGSGKIENIN